MNVATAGLLVKFLMEYINLIPKANSQSISKSI